MEWKYVEEYQIDDKGRGRRGDTRHRRYAHLYEESPSFNGQAPFDAWHFEPFYQILRLRILADRMVQNHEFGVAETKVIVVVPKENRAYLERITSPWHQGKYPDQTVSDIVHYTLVHPQHAYASVPLSLLAGAVRERCGETAISWGWYQRERYGW